MTTALPSAASFTASTTTQGQMKANFTALHDYLAGQFGTDGTPLTARATMGDMLSGINIQSGAYVVVVGDLGKLIYCTGSWTLGLLAAATAGAGFALAVKNGGSGTITIDPNSAETVDGAATVSLAAGESCLLLCTGTAWQTVAKQTNVPAKGGQIFTSSGTFTVPSGVTSVRVSIVGGGGGGNSWYSTIGGYGGAGYAAISGLTPGGGVAVTVGAGGASSPNTATAGSGGTSSFGGYCSATGGQGAGIGSGANGATSNTYANNAITPLFVYPASNGWGGGGVYGSNGGNGIVLVEW